MSTPTPRALHLLCAGAAQGLVKALQAEFEREHGVVLQTRFGAVGAMRDLLSAGEPCDVFVVTERMVADLVATGALQAAPRGALGRMRTGIAVRRGERQPDIRSAESLRILLLHAPALYFPDPERATAGIHFARVLAELGLSEAVRDRVRTYPNGATAMREMAASGPVGAVGCTQVSEILYTEGVELVSALPARFELSTPYAAAVSAHAAQTSLAEALVKRLAGAGTQALRRNAGFDD